MYCLRVTGVEAQATHCRMASTILNSNTTYHIIVIPGTLALPELRCSWVLRSFATPTSLLKIEQSIDAFTAKYILTYVAGNRTQRFSTAVEY